MSENNQDLPEAKEPRPLRSRLAESELEVDARLLGQALQGLHDEPIDDKPPAWAAIEEQALRMARRRRWRYHLGEAWRGFGPLQLAAAAAAVALVLVLGTLGARSLSSRIEARNGATQLRDAPAADLRQELALQASAAANRVTLRCGAVLELADGNADIEQRDAQHPSIHLRRGRVSLQVPPLRSGGRLVVTTSDADVIVHGTRFSVKRQEAEDATLVEVQEGLVEVRPLDGQRSAIFLRAGEKAVVPSHAAYLRQLGTQIEALIDGARCDEKASRVLDTYLAAVPAETDVSGALYLRGSCAAVSGDVTTALAAFEKVAAQARSELRADNALARIAQLRAATHREGGAAAWRRYLERFPQGLHRDSAQRYLREIPARKPD